MHGEHWLRHALMTFSPIDKLPPLAPPAALEPARDTRPAADGSGASAPLDPHAVLALEAWPSSGPRLFDSPDAASTDASRLQSPEELDRIAAHVVSFLT
jgi:hypothetical protein